MHCHQVNKSFREINLGSFWEPVNTLRKEKTTKYTDRKTKKVAVNFTWKTHGTNGYHQDCPSHHMFCFSSFIWLFTYLYIELIIYSKQKILYFFSNYFLSFLNPKKLFWFEISLFFWSVAPGKIGKNIFPGWKKKCSTFSHMKRQEKLRKYSVTIIVLTFHCLNNLF